MIKVLKMVDKGKVLYIKDYGQILRFVVEGKELEVNKKALMDWLNEDNVTFNEYMKRRNKQMPKKVEPRKRKKATSNDDANKRY